MDGPSAGSVSFASLRVFSRASLLRMPTEKATAAASRITISATLPTAGAFPNALTVTFTVNIATRTSATMYGISPPCRPKFRRIKKKVSAYIFSCKPFHPASKTYGSPLLIAVIVACGTEQWQHLRPTRPPKGTSRLQGKHLLHGRFTDRTHHSHTGRRCPARGCVDGNRLALPQLTRSGIGRNAGAGAQGRFRPWLRSEFRGPRLGGQTDEHGRCCHSHDGKRRLRPGHPGVSGRIGTPRENASHFLLRIPGLFGRGTGARAGGPRCRWPSAHRVRQEPGAL